MFVARAAELDAVDRLLDPQGALHFLYLMGPGGIGKTEILHAAARRATAAGREVVMIDGRERGWTAEELGAALERASAPCPTLIVFDTFEAVAHLESAWRTQCLPRLPDHARVVAAGRVRLTSVWREDPGWWALSEQVQVGPISVTDSEQLLLRRGVRADLARRFAAQIPGHPLSLALFAEILARDSEASPRLDRHQAVAQALVDKLLSGLSSGARQVLEAASLVVHVTQGLLVHMLALDDGRVEFEELRRWTFVDQTQWGLKVHDVVRAAVAADLAWRDGRRSAELLHRAASYYLDRWQPDLDAAQAGPLVRDALQLLGHSQSQLELLRDDLYVVPVWPAAWPEIEAMVVRHEGPESLAALRHWREAGADIFVCTSDAGRVLGFQSIVHLDRITEVQAARDPGTLPVWKFWRDAGVLDRGRSRYVRHWMAADAYQAISQVQTAFFFQISEFLTASDTAAMVQAFADVAFFRQFVQEFSPQHIPEASFVCDGRSYGCLGQAFVEMTSVDSLRRQVAFSAQGWAHAARAPSPAPAPPPAPAPANRPLIVFERPAFEEAVRDALRSCDRLDVLEACALRSSGWARRGAGHNGDARATAAALRDRLRDESRRLFAGSRDAVLDQVMHRTYFDPGPKQQAIAAELGLSYGSYRRHLGNATRRLIDALWSQESPPT
jgi:hypothetical protein